MKNYDEFKGYCFRLEFDPVSQSFVQQKLDAVMPPPEPPEKPGASVTKIETVRAQKKNGGAQSSISPKAMRSRTCISFRKILPR